MPRRPALSLRALAALAVLGAAGCDDAPAADAGADAAATPDGGRRDAGAADAGLRDGGGDPGDDAGPPPAPGPWTVYVTVGGESRLAVVDLDVDGVATERPGDSLALPSRPGPMARAADDARLYVGMGGSASGVATVALDAAGSPSLLGVTDTPNPVYLAVAEGERLVSAYFGGDELRVHDVSGAPAHPQVGSLTTDDEPHAATLGPSGLVYVPHRNGMTTWWVRLRSDGGLEQVGALASEAGAGPRHVAFHPSGQYAYVVNEYEDSVSAHAVGADGSLTRLSTVSALSGGPSDANTAADVHVSVDGRFVFSTNRGDDSIARFAVGDDGTLTFLGTTPTEARPREMEPTEGGGYLIALGQDSGSLTVYRIEPDGDLTQTSRLALGDNLLWAAAISR